MCCLLSSPAPLSASAGRGVYPAAHCFVMRFLAGRFLSVTACSTAQSPPQSDPVETDTKAPNCSSDAVLAPVTAASLSAAARTGLTASGFHGERLALEPERHRRYEAPHVGEQTAEPCTSCAPLPATPPSSVRYHQFRYFGNSGAGRGGSEEREYVAGASAGMRVLGTCGVFALQDRVLTFECRLHMYFISLVLVRLPVCFRPADSLTPRTFPRPPSCPTCRQPGRFWCANVTLWPSSSRGSAVTSTPFTGA